jgi:hypothetical protein
MDYYSLWNQEDYYMYYLGDEEDIENENDIKETRDMKEIDDNNSSDRERGYEPDSMSEDMISDYDNMGTSDDTDDTEEEFVLENNQEEVIDVDMMSGSINLSNKYKITQVKDEEEIDTREDTTEEHKDDKEARDDDDEDRNYRCRKILSERERIIDEKARRIEDELMLTFEQGDSSFDFGSVPDTGSSLGVMAFNVARKNRIHYDKDVKVNLRNASGKYMNVMGLATIMSKPKYINGRLNKHNKKRIRSKYVITKDMQDEVLVSREDLKRFGVIPECFPRVEVRKTELEDQSNIKKEKAETVKEDIENVTEKYENVPENNDLPIKANKEMKLLLKEYNDVIGRSLFSGTFSYFSVTFSISSFTVSAFSFLILL